MEKENPQDSILSTIETIEEASERHYINCIPSDRLSFIAGAKWQQKNMPIYIRDVDNTSVQIEDGVVIVEKNDKSKVTYSEQEVYEILFKHTEYFFSGNRMSLTEWFDIHKKK